jgi:MinD-like ATPase involved in chromosome partitioning or flagellar assembly
MSNNPGAVAPFPVIRITIADQTVKVNGQMVDAGEDPDLHRVAVHAVARDVAQELNRPVRAIATADGNTTRLVIHPDGSATDIESITSQDAATDESDAQAASIADLEASLRDAASNPTEDHDEVDASSLFTPPRGPRMVQDEAANVVDPDPDATARATAREGGSDRQLSPRNATRERVAKEIATKADAIKKELGGGQAAPTSDFDLDSAANPWVRDAVTDTPTAPPTTRREVRQSFLTQVQIEEPASVGARGALTRAGIRMSPNAAERLERADVLAVSQHWPGPRKIAVLNGKGGANKTPTTILLSAVFALYGGAGVLAWDNNQTRGTLGWRTEQGPHEATLLDLLPQTNRLLGTSAQSADLAHFVHHQTRDKFDVLRSKPMALAHEQRLTPADVDAIHAVSAKYYRLIFIDSGNDESDPMWLRMIDHADQIVVATTTRDDHAEAGALLLEALADRNEQSAALARKAVVVVSQTNPRADRSEAQRTAAGYGGLAREAVTIPFDPAMVDGVLNHGALRPTTQRAWLAAGAAVARGL